MTDTCDWCGDDIPDTEDAIIVVQESAPRRYKISPSFPAAIFHDGTCADEAMRHGWMSADDYL